MSHNFLIIMPEITKGMKSIGSKALLKINSKQTILEHQIRSIKRLNNKNKIFLATGFQHSKIQKIAHNYKNVFTIFEPDYGKYNDTKHIINFTEYVGNYEDLFIINSGILFRNNCFKGVKKNTSKIFLLDKYKDNFMIGCNSPNNTDYLFYDLPNKWSECIFLTKDIIQQIVMANKQQNIHNYFLFETINQMSELQQIQPVIISHRDIMKVSTTSDLIKAKRFV